MYLLKQSEEWFTDTMLSEEKILILNRMKINSPKLYEKALEKLGMQDSDIPVCNVPDEQLWREKQAGQTKQTDAKIRR